MEIGRAGKKKRPATVQPGPPSQHVGQLLPEAADELPN